MRLERKFYANPAPEVARRLLGCVLEHRTSAGAASGTIVETEAYLGPGDMASHARRGPTPRSGIMFEKPGRAYVYFVYGMHHMFNVVTDPEGTAGAVLVRALEPLEGLRLMESRRGVQEAALLTSGPARLTQALGITLEQNGMDMWNGPLGIYDGRNEHDFEVEETPRIGVVGSREKKLRFLVKGNAHVSPTVHKASRGRGA